MHLAHQWWVWQRGGGRVFEDMASLFPEADVSMIVHAPETFTPAMAGRRIHVSALQLVSPRWIDHRKLLPLFPWAVRGLSAPDGTRLLLTSDAAVIKGMRKPPGCVQVCYCHSPPRYLWEMTEEYAGRTSGLGAVGRAVFRRSAERVRCFDLQASANVDHFIANSAFVAERIRRCYGREASVLHPAVNLARLVPNGRPPEDFYLVVSELVSYKRVDLAVEACTRLGRRLVVVGDGAEASRLRAMAGPTVEFHGRAGDEVVSDLLARCRAFLHPQIEDFGLTPVEAQACGRPVIALGRGGALETVQDGRTGLFFTDQTVDVLMDAMERFEKSPGMFSPEQCRAQATLFSRDRFLERLRGLLMNWAPEAQI
ncbi:MAG: glycosyltransferase [Verrucomicrobiota bacterium]